MKASDIMTREVVAVSPATAVTEVARIMLDHRISGVPVVDHGRIVGIVTENDLLRRVEVGTQKTRPRWLHLFTSADARLSEYVKSRGGTARDTMTPNVVTVSSDTPIAAIAEILESHQIKRVPVVDGGKMVGIVSRANLVQALATVAHRVSEPTEVDDKRIRDDLYAEIRKIGWVLLPNNATVSNGIVHLWGDVRSNDERETLRIAAGRIPGVKEVRDHRRELQPRS